MNLRPRPFSLYLLDSSALAPIRLSEHSGLAPHPYFAVTSGGGPSQPHRYPSSIILLTVCPAKLGFGEPLSNGQHRVGGCRSSQMHTADPHAALLDFRMDAINSNGLCLHPLSPVRFTRSTSAAVYGSYWSGQRLNLWGVLALIFSVCRSRWVARGGKSPFDLPLLG